MTVHYLEVVTPNVDAVCAAYADAHHVTFGAAVPELGGARLAELAGGGLLGVRAPLRDDESPVVRPYTLVDDLAVAVAAAESAGAHVALAGMPLGDYGSCAIVILGGNELGFWAKAA